MASLNLKNGQPDVDQPDNSVDSLFNWQSHDWSPVNQCCCCCCCSTESCCSWHLHSHQVLKGFSFLSIFFCSFLYSDHQASLSCVWFILFPFQNSSFLNSSILIECYYPCYHHFCLFFSKFFFHFYFRPFIFLIHFDLENKHLCFALLFPSSDLLTK